MTETIIVYAIGLLTGLLIALMLLNMQALIMKNGAHDKPVLPRNGERAESNENADKLAKQFDNFLSYTGRQQNDS